MKVRKYPYRISLYDGKRFVDSFIAYAKNGTNAARGLRRSIIIHKNISLHVFKIRGRRRIK